MTTRTTAPVKKRLLNVPNILSGYRLLSMPFLVMLIFMGHRKLFAILFLISLVTDILDGFIARLCRQETEFGARLDSLADVATYYTAVLGIIVLAPEFILSHLLEIFLLVGLYVAAQLIAVVRFRRLHSMHLYSGKATAYVQGGFLVSFFLFGYSPILFYAMVVISLLASIEEIATLLALRECRSNARGLYWVLRGAAVHE